ncbi:hypothetical protein Tco_0629801 [Tanacetum coccineum]|uniref:Reverse transcriptase domain-containing protein n=1 Tax=Tanacetum coccineum TaxID=301880 RepID=A0ABQ4WU72_9ASTR
MQTAHDRQKSYADEKHKPMDFQVGDKVTVKVSPWKGVVRFGKQGKLNPRGVFELIANCCNWMDYTLTDSFYLCRGTVGSWFEEVKQLRHSRVPIVKVRWNSKRGPEFTWEREDQFKKKYPHLFMKTAPSSSTAS